MRTELDSPPVAVAATPMQESLWWVHQRARNKSVYNITWRLTCDRPVDVDALGTAWQALVDRHEALRTSMVRPDDAVRMVVHPQVRAQVRTVEVDPPESVDTGELLRLIAEEAQEQETVLDGESLGRLTVVRVGDRHELLLTVHHLVVDGWGMQLITEELSTAYAAAAAGRVPEFAEEAVPFRVYAAEQHDERTREAWAPSLEYWRKTLDGTVATTVTAANCGEFIPGAPGVVIRYSFSEPACAAITALAKRLYATPFAIFQGAMHVVLVRGGGGPDVALGAVLANRMTPRDQALVGYTANLCISRATVSETDTILEVMTRARDTVWTMLMHQAVPYPLVFGALPEATQRTLTEDSPLGLSHLGPIGSGLRLGEVGLTLQPSPNRAARADISISTWDADGRYHAEIELNTGRYDRTTVEWLLADMDDVLVVGGKDPDRVVGTLDVRTRATVAHVDHVRASPHPVPAELPAAGSDAWRHVIGLWSRLVGDPPAGPDVNFFTAGGHSMTLLRLASELEAATGRPIDVVEWLSDPTPRRLVELVDGTGDGPASGGSTLVTIRDGTGPHVHLLHGASGDPNDFHDLVVALPADWRVTASREQEPLAGVPAMASRYGADLAAAGLRPDILCGWSMGGQVAYELASRDPAPPALVILDSPPPVGYEHGPDEELFAVFAGAFADSAGAPRMAPRVVGDPTFWPRVLAACLTAAGRGLSVGVITERWRAYARHARSGEAYVGPAQVPAGALVVAAGQRDEDQAEWARRVGGASLLRVPADHYGVLRADAAARVAAELVRFATNHCEKRGGTNGC